MIVIATVPRCTREFWAAEFLHAIYAPTSRKNLLVLVAWQTGEGTAAHYNPLATTHNYGRPSKPYNTAGVQNFTCFCDGVYASKRTLLQAVPGYVKIIAALRDGDHNAHDTSRLIEASPWGTHRVPIDAVIAGYNTYSMYRIG